MSGDAVIDEKRVELVRDLPLSAGSHSAPSEGECPDGMCAVHVGELCLERIAPVPSAVTEPEKDEEPEAFWVVMNAPPSPTSEFVEVETADGRGIKAGEWTRREDGLWALGPFYSAPPENAPMDWDNVAERLGLADAGELVDHLQYGGINDIARHTIGGWIDDQAAPAVAETGDNR